MDLETRWPTGMSYEAFLQSCSTPRYAERMREVEAAFALTPEDQAFWAQFRGRGLRVLVVGAEWCPDVIQHLPVLMHIARAAGMEVRIWDRDSNPDLMTPATYLSPDGKQRIPVFAFLDRKGRELGRWIERSRLAEGLVAARRALLPPPGHPDFAARNREMYRDLGEEYRRGYLHQAAARELRELLAPHAHGEVLP